MKRKYFGTDGIRGTANSFPMTPDIALKVGQAAGSYFTNGGHPHKVVIGKDTRLSGYMIESALTAGFVSVGMNVVLVGPMPTPAVAMLTRSLRADLGVMISASHNPYHDNGIKLFDNIGLKLSDEVELEIEKRISGDEKVKLADPSKLGRAKRLDDAPGRYIEFVKHTFPRNYTLDGLKVILDCSNGAAYHLGPTILWELEAEVKSIGISPNGFNINDKCGSTSPELLCQEVVKQGADIGIALDGDADRLVVCDEKGQVIDGDQIMAIIARHQLEIGSLKGGGIVATSMSNMGLERYLETLGLNLHRTEVGDRYVSKYMREQGYNVGGEQSGHIILRDYMSTGDGLIAALQLLAVIVNDKRPASQVCKAFEPFPQTLKNIKFKDGDPLNKETVKNAISNAEKELGNNG
ncbi:phosphoglucosamine mutase, partial [Rickettsiales bacterium]|nr:phosphoglucosamine mutase [Rickettsiales bacterium]